MFRRFSYLPTVCLLVSLFRLLTRKLKYSAEYRNEFLQMEDGSFYKIFRQITISPGHSSGNDCMFIVRFKFRHLSYRANRFVSIIPMLLIAGHPGFVSKCYAVNEENGYWQGIYQWKSLQDLELYKKSFVFRMMNKRAIAETIVSQTITNQTLSEFIYRKRNQTEDIYLTNFPILII